MTRRFALLAAAVFVITAACAGDNADDSGDNVASLSGVGDDEVIAVPQPGEEVETPSQEEALFEFAACMRDNGLDIEDPTVDADGNVAFQFRGGASPQDAGFDREAARTARNACSDLLEGVTLGFGRGDITEIQDTLFDYAACMRENGYDMSDPDFGNFGPGNGGGQAEPGLVVGPFGEIDPEDPVFAGADEVCSEILSGFGPGGGGGRLGDAGGPGRQNGGGNG